MDIKRNKNDYICIVETRIQNFQVNKRWPGFFCCMGIDLLVYTPSIVAHIVVDNFRYTIKISQ